jgi:hypothetical protein
MAGRRAAEQSAAPSLTLLAVCDAAVREPNSQKVTLYGLFDTMFVDDLPTVAQFTILAKLRGGRGTHSLALVFAGRDGKNLFEGKQDVKLECAPEKNAEIVATVMTKIKRLGNHTVQVMIDDKPVGEPFRVMVKRGQKT